MTPGYAIVLLTNSHFQRLLYLPSNTKANPHSRFLPHPRLQPHRPHNILRIILPYISLLLGNNSRLVSDADHMGRTALRAKGDERRFPDRAGLENGREERGCPFFCIFVRSSTEAEEEFCSFCCGRRVRQDTNGGCWVTMVLPSSILSLESLSYVPVRIMHELLCSVKIKMYSYPLITNSITTLGRPEGLPDDIPVAVLQCMCEILDQS